MASTDKYELMHMRQLVLRLKANHAVRPIKHPERPVIPNVLSVQIINGQLINSIIPVIQYAADPLTVPSAYDPNVATSYVSGIGNGYLYNPLGQQLGKVLVRHNWIGFQDPVMAGDVYTVGQPINVAVAGGGFVAAFPILGMW